MRILIAGASGFLGTRLRENLVLAGHDVTSLVRRAPGNHEAHWDPYAARLDPALVESTDVVVNLAGSPTLGNPHSKKWADNLLNSRVTTTRVLAEAIAASSHRPAFLAGNGISYYGDRGSEVLTEDADSRGDAYLTEVTRQWQAAAQPAVDAGARVCILRTAPVLDADSAPLKQLLLLFKAGLGGKLSSGDQYFPIISVEDWVAAVTYCAEHEDLSGPVNLVCPNPPTNAEFTTALAALVRRPAFFGVPGPALRLAAGRMAPELLGSVRAVPEALTAAGFRFADRDVNEILRAATA
ncbi:MAG: TIGR01777 family oxidoreductase [Propionibacteriales bacterium]|nr:TIGR01777 family oxidoreductase [Propionibacteriales bacterium]